ncbi:hypothetical protein RJ55_07256 [Drechmeria coniospora]|nr:hypothetical protein RJ55_07256 [Drechmeria coniospora]
MRTKYNSLVQDLLRKCRNSKHSRPSNTRWDDSLAILDRILPSDRNIPIARIGPISTVADGADVWSTTEDDIENLTDQEFILQKPTVVRSRQLRQRGQGLDQFLEILGDHFGGGKVDVQNPRTTTKSPVSFPVYERGGSFTGFHVDSPDGTWVCNEWGLKLWTFATDEDESDMVKFADEGDNWIPEKVIAIVLEPDSRMAGGMFMDAYRILESIEKLLWIATHPLVSNEPIPLQLLGDSRRLRDFCARTCVVNVPAHVGSHVPPAGAHCQWRRMEGVLLGAMLFPQGKEAEPRTSGCTDAKTKKGNPVNRVQRSGAQAIVATFLTVATSVAEAEAHIASAQKWFRTVTNPRRNTTSRIRKFRRYNRSPFNEVAMALNKITMDELETINPFTLSPWTERVQTMIASPRPSVSPKKRRLDSPTHFYDITISSTRRTYKPLIVEFDIISDLSNVLQAT